MKKTHQPFRRSHQGYALLIVVVFIGLALLLLGSVMAWTSSSAKQTARNNLYSSAQAAAEGADETIIAYLARDFYNQSYNGVASYETKLPSQNGWPVTFSFSNGSVPNQTGLTFGNGTYGNNWPPPIWLALGQQYQGLNAWVIPGTVNSTATALHQPYSVPATVNEQFQLASIPLCQFAIFYNMDLEICPGGNMTVNGKTYVNGTIWADPSQTLLFDGTVNTTAPQVMYTRSPNDPQASKANPDVVYAITNSPTTNSPALVLPVGTNSYQMGTNNNAASVAAILDLPPPGVNPDSQSGQEYLYNQADIIISNSASGLISAFYQNNNNVNRLTPIPNDVTNVVNNSTNTYYSFVTNVSFYDYRESDTVKAVQLDVGAFNSWLSGKGAGYNNQNNGGSTSKGHSINSVYIYNSVPLSGTQLPAVRTANGSVLPAQGLTVATPDPIYVLGNYNATGAALGTTDTSGSAPAGLLADAITILSTSWSDNYTSSTPLSSRNAGNTTVNAATLEGIVPSTTVNGVKQYSGGVENFLRLLENWSGDTLTYNGSINVMFASRYATNFWQTPGNYYNVPTRNWGFDANYAQGQNKLPPMFPQVKVMIRQQWTAN